MKLLNVNFLFIILFFTISCSNSSDNEIELSIVQDPEVIYSEALTAFNEQNYELASEKFSEIDLKFPLSKEAIQSQIMIAFIEYSRLEYDLAIIKLDKIIKKYPAYKDMDYVYYLKAMCYYERVENPELDGSYNTLALQSFNETINYFPDSKYAKDSYQKIILLKENVAAKHMSVGLFYLNQKKYLAALKRYQKVIEEHSESKFTPEALHRLVEIYYSLGMMEEAKKTASVLGYNYSDSKWYKYSYNLVVEKNNNSKKTSIFKRIFNKNSPDNEE